MDALQGIMQSQEGKYHGHRDIYIEAKHEWTPHEVQCFGTRKLSNPFRKTMDGQEARHDRVGAAEAFKRLKRHKTIDLVQMQWEPKAACHFSNRARTRVSSVQELVEFWNLEGKAWVNSRNYSQTM